MNSLSRFFEVLSDTFDFGRHRTGRAIALFAFSALALGILVNALFGIAAALSLCLLYPLGWTTANDPASAFRTASEQLVVPILLAVIAFSLGYLNYRSHQRLTSLALEPPDPMEGLILMLSPFFDRRGACAHPTPETVLKALANQPRDTVRGELLKSNWGPQIAAIEHHAPVLKHGWILCTEGTGGSAAQFEAAAKIFAAFAPNAKFHQSTVANAHDVSCIIPVVEAIYRPGENQNIDPARIIADFTGGTAAMSGGMILATLNEERQVEYLRQDRPLDINGRPLDKDEILKSKALVTIKTTPALVDKYADASLAQSHTA